MISKTVFGDEFIKKHGFWFVLFGIIAIHLFLRFYQIEIRNPFGWDQVGNAWEAKNIIIDHRLPLLGVAAKLNSGFFLGPLYYYFISFFYWILNLDPLASGIAAGITSLINLSVLFYVTKKIFSSKVAFLSAAIYVISYHLIVFDRNQWNVNFIISVSLGIFYCLYNILIVRERYLVLLAVILGLSFHVHFTSVFYLIIILVTVPFIKDIKVVLRYLPISVILFIVLFIPNIIAELSSNNVHTVNLINYLKTYFQGFHLVRVMQVANDGFIEFQSLLESVSQLKNLAFLKFIFLPLFCLVYYLPKRSKNGFILCFLVFLWFLIPWLGFSLYSGEISNYYFSLTLPIAIIILAYLSVRLFLTRFLFLKILIVFFWVYYSIINISMFFNNVLPEEYRLTHYRKIVSNAIRKGHLIEFQEGVPQSYIYYISTRK